LTIAAIALSGVATLTPLAQSYPLRARSPHLFILTAMVHPLAYAVISIDIFINRVPQAGYTRIAVYLWWILYSAYAWSYLARLFHLAARFVAQAGVIGAATAGLPSPSSDPPPRAGRRHHSATVAGASSASASGRSAGSSSPLVRLIAAMLRKDVGAVTLGAAFALGALLIHGILLLAAIGLVGFDTWADDAGDAFVTYDEPYIVHFSALGVTAVVSLYGAYVMGNSPRDHTKVVSETRTLAIMWLVYTLLVWLPVSLFVGDDGVPTYLIALPPIVGSFCVSVLYPVYQATKHRFGSTISAEYTAAVDFPSPPSDDLVGNTYTAPDAPAPSSRTPVRPPPRVSDMQVVTAAPRSPDETKSVEWNGRIRSLSELRAASNRYLFPSFAKFLASGLEAHLLLFIEDVRVWRGLPASSPDKAQLALHICRQYLTQHSFMRIWGLPPVTLDEYRNPGSLPADFFDARLRAVTRHLQNDSLPRFFASEEFIMAERADVAAASGRTASGARAARGTTEAFMSEIDSAYGRFFQDSAGPANSATHQNGPRRRSRRSSTKALSRSAKLSRHSSRARVADAAQLPPVYGTGEATAMSHVTTNGSHYHETSLYPQPM